jgi:hypothetical protein
MASMRKHLTYANVVATLALIVAVAGGSAAIAISVKVKKNSVGTKQIKKGSITAGKLADGAVTNVKLADGSVTGSKLTGTRIAKDQQAPNVQADIGCATGEKMLSGGGASSGGALRDSFPGGPDGWRAIGSGGGESSAFAVCLKATPGG